MNAGCESFIRAVIGGKLSGAIAALATLDWGDVFRCFSTIDRADLDDLGKLSAPAITPLFQFAISTVKNGRSLRPPPASATPDFDNAVSEHLHRIAMEGQPLHFDADLTGALTSACWSCVALTHNDYKAAADGLGIETEAIQAVASVESAGSGFGRDGLPKIRYELHVFSKETHHKYTPTHPWLSQNSYETGNGFHDSEQSTEYSMLFNAMILKHHGKRRIKEAIEATSWGKFQIMGLNHGAAGWADAVGFASDAFVMEANHLKGFVNFVKSKNLAQALKDHDWAKFALHYNGSKYKSHDYDGQMARAYEHFKNPAAHQAHIHHKRH